MKTHLPKMLSNIKRANIAASLRMQEVLAIAVELWLQPSDVVS
jgi:hypothetical protein